METSTTQTTFGLALVVGLTLTGFNSSAQVVNEVNVYVRPGTEVHVFENLTNANTGTFTVDQGGLLYVDGTLVNNGNMTFNNAASLLRGSTGSDGTGSGVYYVKRQGSSGGIYNFWSSPMTSFNGVPGNPSYLFDSDLGNQDPSDDQPADPGWVAYSGNMVPGSGYAGRGAGLFTFSGDVNNGNINYPLTFHAYSPGSPAAGTPFNLCGNPYPSAISCASLVAANPDVNGSIYFWDDDLSGGSGYAVSDFAVWNGTGSLGTGSGNAGAPNGYISTGQGFQIRALNNSAVLNFTNNMRFHNNAQFFRADDEISRLFLSLEGNDLYNQILIGLLEDATDGEDRLYDAFKIRGNYNISLASLDGDGNEYAIMAFPPPSIQRTIPLSVNLSQGGVFRFHANSMENFEGYNVYFHDTRTGQNALLHEGTQVEVVISAGETYDRFYLNFVQFATGISEAALPSANLWAGNDELLHVQLSGTNMETALIELFDLQGKLLVSRQLTFASGMATTPLSGLCMGAYIARISSDEVNLSKRILKQ